MALQCVQSSTSGSRTGHIRTSVQWESFSLLREFGRRQRFLRNTLCISKSFLKHYTPLLLQCTSLIFSTHRGQPASFDELQVSEKQWFVLSGGAFGQLSLPQELVRQCCQLAVCLSAIAHEQSSRTKGAWRDALATRCDAVPSV